jgi:high-affinity Fe2+/Pb2+ permease
LVNTTIAVSILLMTVAVVLNLVATICVMRSTIYITMQKMLQLALVWMIPFAGAIFVLSVWAHDRASASRDAVRYDEGLWMPGIGPEGEHRYHGDNFGEAGSHDSHGGDTGSSGH